ncbi:hypothetical protein ACFOU2_17240 [Bacillus songklensis]|uniref:Uncharacterized protein n=1 Tax=Bacillus songklensis TaxID=1069116 RepID=A0ABV8B7F4_9BACI
MYLYYAVDSERGTIDFSLSKTREKSCKALREKNFVLDFMALQSIRPGLPWSD